MSRVTPALRKFAEQLLAREAKATKSSTSIPGQAFPVIEKLRPHLTNFLGKTGFRALLARALVLATAENPTLRAVHISAEGNWAGLEELEAQVRPANFFEARVALVAQLLGLLVAFIGEALMLQLVSDAWPNHSFNNLDFGKRERNEKAI